MKRQSYFVFVLLSAALAMASIACKKKVPVSTAAPVPKAVAEQPADPQPVIDVFTGRPASIERGQTATLRWVVKDAAEVSISQGIGVVSMAGSREVGPTEPTTYELKATGPGGTVSAAASIHVTFPQPAPPPPPSSQPMKVSTMSDRLANAVGDVFYDFDASALREDARYTLGQNARLLKSIFREFPTGDVVIEGHCDERGSAEYNLGLGDRRAASAKEYLIQLGVPGERLGTVSYGKEKPQCIESDDRCWQRNRRAHFNASGN